MEVNTFHPLSANEQVPLLLSLIHIYYATLRIFLRTIMKQIPCATSVITHVIAVSYTHLDVYKRQLLGYLILFAPHAFVPQRQ